jgi:DNA ligase-1
VVRTWQQVAATASRGEKVARLAETLCALDVEEAPLAVQYLAGQLPQGRLGVGPAALQALAAVPAAAEARLSLAELDQRLAQIAEVSGAGAAARRRVLLEELFADADALEQRFLARLLGGELRAGALGGVMIEAIAAAAALPAAAVRRAAMYAGQLGALARAAFSGAGEQALQAFQLRTLSPLEPMLAQTAESVAGALERLGGRAAFEYKLDGARVQLHKLEGQVRLFTRRLNEVAAYLPEVVEWAGALAERELVLDGEVVALDEQGRPRPFQVTMQRFGLRRDVPALRERLPVQAFFFDCLRSGSQTLVARSGSERFEALSQAVPETHRVPRLVTDQAREAQDFYEAALAAGHEGLMAKALDSPYEAGQRGAAWLKIKRAHTLDLVVLAAEWGHGRRSGWLSNLHLGARIDASLPAQATVPEPEGRFAMLGKTFKGLTDAMLAWQTRELLARERGREGGIVYVWPTLVVEVAFNDIQSSPRYPAGLALRFARVRAYREDKSAAEADTVETVRQLYRAQTGAL